MNTNAKSAAATESPLSPTKSSELTHALISPLTPEVTPTPATAPLPSVDIFESDLPPQSVWARRIAYNRSRGLSVSTIRATPDGSQPVNRITSNPLPQKAFPSFSSLTLVDSYDQPPQSRGVSSKGRSDSPRRGDWGLTWRITQGRSQTPPHEPPTSWWNAREPISRPWEDKRHKSVPSEQTEGWLRTRQRVAAAAVNVLGTAGEATHEVLVVSVELLEFAPLPGLQAAARSLLEIWDALQMVEINRSACLRLTERCATILFSVREDIAEAGDQVGQELLHPIERLVDAFSEVHRLLQKQNHRPFIKRYLNREKIQRHIERCDRELNDALRMFNLSIQVRILKQVLKVEEQQRTDHMALLERLAAGQLSPQPITLSASPANALELSGAGEAPIKSIDQLLLATPEQIRATLQQVMAQQNEQDLASDIADMRQLMRSALQENNDVEMIRVLQVGRDEMPEAIKALQRALEAETNREMIASELEDTVMVASISSAAAGVGANLTRSMTVASVESKRTASDRSNGSYRMPRDTLDREFMESGIDALRRISMADTSLPSWVITLYEVDRDEKIGIGFFSDVYKGTWKEHTVAIKVLAETTPRKLFIQEVNIWKQLKHPHVLELLGASSTTADPPWFFVSPYMKNGSLVSYLKGLPSLDAVDVLKMTQEIAKGMSYLHGQGVLHGDLKGSNVLVNDRGHCVITDFGQSEIKSEVYRISGTAPPHGTLRWQAPELMAGQGLLTQQIDVYAFGMCCIEILTKGGLPWPLADDEAVRHFVLRENKRPETPALQRAWLPFLVEIVHSAWHWDPQQRPSFTKIVRDIQKLRERYSPDIKSSPSPHYLPMLLSEEQERKSPDMRPVPLPPLPPDTTATFIEENSFSPDASFHTPNNSSFHVMDSPPRAFDFPSDGLDFNERDCETRYDDLPSPPILTRSSSISSPDSRSEFGVMLDPPGYLSPPPIDETLAEIVNERRYRMLLQHEYHPSLTLPLWTPIHVPLGAVGYLSRPSGTFIPLFDAFKPLESSDTATGAMASLQGYGNIPMGSSRNDKRGVARRGMDMLHAWLAAKSGSSSAIARQYSTPLRAGHKTAHLFTEATVYNYMKDLVAAKRWFKANIDCILKLYGPEHHLSREDVILVIGTLDAQDYGLFVSHSHPDGQLHFNVYSSPKVGQTWGHFSTTTDPSSSLAAGPVYADEPLESERSAKKVSSVGHGGPWDTVLLARLRFKTDSAEPTSQ
ncbi:uncharacterized protein LAESUDRAFT_750759 [Laetiporus sulphureus 93-53]|uniref:Protein kinase domain-containing protein n=1 Tax=Laetiporus sulphureus 93-53 TaxID=1314785 RepID=A0A165DJX9_9APHY|nr:uncharacterized protein LAESUDRAFT_750759 [Laetiporus sulphureus 93-53]KZT05047.1 hypothetical protein LAESUDRAFT_750759 [Laetiporus sulphureus 93-53]